MKRIYLIIAVSTILVIILLIYGFTRDGSPLEKRDRQFDQIRESNLHEIKYQIESYSRKNAYLPEKLSDLEPSSYSRYSLTDPETKKQYEYKKNNALSYTLCADFKTDTKKQNNSYIYSNKSFIHGKGHVCFDFTVQPSTRAGNYMKYVTPTPKQSTTFEDPNILNVTTDAKFIANSIFPHGLFSSNATEYGLNNYDKVPVTITVYFKKPVKISYVYLTLYNCNNNSWSAMGYTAANKVVEILPSITVAGSNTNCEHTPVTTVGLEESFTKITLTITPDQNYNYKNQYVVSVKKIKFIYES